MELAGEDQEADGIVDLARPDFISILTLYVSRYWMLIPRSHADSGLE
jgi:hypothetical protein